MYKPIKRQNKHDSQKEEILVDNIAVTTGSQKTNYKKSLMNYIGYANEGIHSSINSFQSMQKTSHVHEMPSFILTDDLFTPEKKFLGYCTLEDIYHYIDKYGIKKELEIKGYNNIVINFDTSDYFVHRLSITDKSLLNYNGQFLIDLFMRNKDFIVSDFKSYQILRRVENKQIEKTKYIDNFGAMKVYKFMESHLNEKYSLSLIEWICMQDPRSEFSQNRPQFPGQNYPGLRVGRKVDKMLIDLATRKGRDGLSNIPEHFHNAYIYRMQDYTFLNPVFQAYFDCLCDSLKNDLKVHGLSAVSWAFHNGHVKNHDGEMELWDPEEQVYPISSRLHSYFGSHDYKKLYDTFFRRGYQVSIDWNNAKEIWKFSLNNEFNEAINDDIIDDVTNKHHENAEYIWTTEKSKL